MMCADRVMVACPMVDRPIPDGLKNALGSTGLHVEATHGLNQELARSLLVSEAMNRKMEAIFFIDSDMDPAEPIDEIVERFFVKGMPIVSAMTSTRGRSQRLLLFKKRPGISYPMMDEKMYIPNEVLNVYAIGFGACLIHMSVFERIGMPWFRTNWDYTIPETGEERVVGGVGMGADFFFSMRCNQEGILMHVDCGTVVHHMEMSDGMKYPTEDKMMEVFKDGK